MKRWEFDAAFLAAIDHQETMVAHTPGWKPLIDLVWEQLSDRGLVAPEVASWISVESRKPEIGVDVLCYWGAHTPMEVGTYSGHNSKRRWDVWQASNGDMHEFDADPTHWMPLPASPVSQPQLPQEAPHK